MATLTTLPVELVEQICKECIDVERFSRYPPEELYNLRLTCREMHRKTIDFFAKSAFGGIRVTLNSKGLQRLERVTAWPLLAESVHTLMLIAHKGMTCSREEYEAARDVATSNDSSARQRRDARSVVWKSDREQGEKEFMQRSGRDSIKLAMALRLLTNLQGIYVVCTDLRDWRGDHEEEVEEGSTTRLFSLLCAALPYAKQKLLKLMFTFCSANKWEEGVSLAALSLPRDVMESVSQLQELHLWLQTRDAIDKPPQPRQLALLAKLLVHTPQVRRLRIGFRNDSGDTAAVFKPIADTVLLPQLTHLKVDNINCHGGHLEKWFSHHTGLLSIELSRINVTGDVAFADIMGLLQTQHTSLTKFACRQIAQNSMRVYFKSLGEIECRKSPTISYEKDRVPDFFDDFTDVNMPYRYEATAEWVDIQKRLGLLKEDVRVSGKSSQAESVGEWYKWYEV